MALVPFLLGTTAAAAIVCEGNSERGKVKITIDDGSTVTVEGAALTKPVVFNQVAKIYDGHATFLLTAPGLAIKMPDIFGCIRDVEVITNLRDFSPTGFIAPVRFDVCQGGTTPDETCFRNSQK